jgi:hypothetical protein
MNTASEKMAINSIKKILNDEIDTFEALSAVIDAIAEHARDLRDDFSDIFTPEDIEYYSAQIMKLALTSKAIMDGPEEE